MPDTSVVPLESNPAPASAPEGQNQSAAAAAQGAADHGASVVNDTVRATRNPPGPQLLWDDGTAVDLSGACVIGRNPTAGAGARAVAVDDPSKSLSKTHVRIETTSAGLTVTDMKSTNGTTIQRGDVRTPLSPHTPTPLAPGDVLLLGRRRATVTGIQQ